MRIVLVGDTHGLLDKMYKDASALGADAIIQVGDTGIWGSIDAVDAATKRHGFPRDYEKFLSGEVIAPIPTYFIKGNHEDFDLLAKAEKSGGCIADNMMYVPNGRVLELGGVRFGMLGGNYSSSYFDNDRLHGARRRHFTRRDLESLAEQRFDVLVSHDGPKSSTLDRGADVLRSFVEAVQPVVNFHGHHHYAYRERIGATAIVGLAKNHRPGGVEVFDGFL